MEKYAVMFILAFANLCMGLTAIYFFTCFINYN